MAVLFSKPFRAPSFDPSGEITLLLHQWRRGDNAVGNHLFEIVEPNLRKLAHYLMKAEWRNHPFQATELVSEAYLKLVNARDRDWENRRHFFALAATIMRRHLIDIVRRSEPTMAPQEAADDKIATKSPEDALALSELLDQLSRIHPDWCTVVEMKHFLGFTDEELGKELGMPIRTVQRIWHDARKWLFDRCDRRGEAFQIGFAKG